MSCCRLKTPLLFLAFVTVYFVACSGGSPEQHTAQTNSGSVTSSTPPFATREPERYRATRVITTSREGSDSYIVTTRIARDGGNRREEHQATSGTVVYLENADGSFIVHPTQKLYAAINDGAGNASTESQLADVPPLDQARGETTYELLGTEQLGERQTTKYRVTYGTKADETVPQVETLIWIDQSLGMPIRTETKSVKTIVLMELKEIATEVDLRLFQMPKDYKRVDIKALVAEQSKEQAGQ